MPDESTVAKEESELLHDIVLTDASGGATVAVNCVISFTKIVAVI